MYITPENLNDVLSAKVGRTVVAEPATSSCAKDAAVHNVAADDSACDGNGVSASDSIAVDDKAAKREALAQALQEFEGKSSGFDVVALSEEAQEAFKQIERWVAVHDRSTTEIRNRLRRKEYSEAAIEQAIKKAGRCLYVDDVRFADNFVRSKLRAGKGLCGIVRSLGEHNINPYVMLEGFPEQYLCEAPSQEQAAFTLLCNKPPRAKNAKQAAYAKLIRNGYDSGIAMQATRRWFSEVYSNPE